MNTGFIQNGATGFVVLDYGRLFEAYKFVREQKDEDFFEDCNEQYFGIKSKTGVWRSPLPNVTRVDYVDTEDELNALIDAQRADDAEALLDNEYEAMAFYGEIEPDDCSEPNDPEAYESWPSSFEAPITATPEPPTALPEPLPAPPQLMLVEPLNGFRPHCPPRLVGIRKGVLCGDGPRWQARLYLGHGRGARYPARSWKKNTNRRQQRHPYQVPSFRTLPLASAS